MKAKALFVLAILLVMTSIPAIADQRPTIEYITARVWKVTDGDTVHLLFNSALCGRVIRSVRLADGCDAPERYQPYGDVATKRLRELLDVKILWVEFSGRQTYGRLVARITVPGGPNVSEQLCAEGLAWVDERYAKGEHGRRLREAMQRAKAAGRGLWADDNPIPPREWRRGRRK